MQKRVAALFSTILFITTYIRGANKSFSYNVPLTLTINQTNKKTVQLYSLAHNKVSCFFELIDNESNVPYIELHVRYIIWLESMLLLVNN